MIEPVSNTSKPYLKSGTGWLNRTKAVLEDGRRYLPRGGPLNVYNPNCIRAGKPKSTARKQEINTSKDTQSEGKDDKNVLPDPAEIGQLKIDAAAIAAARAAADSELGRLQNERAEVTRLKSLLQVAIQAAERERHEVIKVKDLHEKKYSEEKSEEIRKMRNERLALQRQARRLATAPAVREENNNIAELQQLIAKEKGLMEAKDAKHRLTLERLRRQLEEAHSKNAELQDQIASLQGQQLRDLKSRVATNCPSSIEKKRPQESIKTNGATVVHHFRKPTPSSPGKQTHIHRYANGDIMRSLPDGITEYYFSRVDCWQVTFTTTKADNLPIEVYHFSSGHSEAHHPDGTKELTDASGVALRILSDGQRQIVSYNELSSAIKRSRPAT